MNLTFTEETTAFDDFTSWAQDDRRIYKKIITLLKDIQRHPFDGIGKPEPLKYELSGYWSRRITEEHRLIYRVSENEKNVIISSCKYHYINRK